MSMEDRRATSLITGRLAYNNSTNSWSLRPMAVSGKYLSEGAAREWSTVVSISIHPPSFKPVSLSLSRSPLSKTPKQVFFNPINILTLLHTLLLFYNLLFRLTSTFIFTGKNTCFADVVPEMQKRLSDILGRVKIAPPPTGIIMTKGESLPVPSLAFKVGLGWDQVGAAVDLDASVVCLKSDLSLSDACFFGKLKVYNGALQHSGDNRSGEGSGDDESISVQLNRLPADVKYACVVVNCYDNVPLSNVRNAYIRLLSNTGVETHRYNLSALGARCAYLMCTIYRDRHTNQWMLKTNSTEADGNTYKAMMPAIQQAVSQLYSK